jgi:glucosamine-phosphate N-acetyltransferase
MQIKIVKLDKENLHSYFYLLRQLSPLAELPKGESTCLVYRNLLNQETKDIFLAVAMNQAVGTISIQYETKINRPPRDNQVTALIAHIEDVVVDEPYRNQGIGKQLVLHALEVAKKHECYKVILDCDEKNVKFYEACGLKVSGMHMRIDT